MLVEFILHTELCHASINMAAIVSTSGKKAKIKRLLSSSVCFLLMHNPLNIQSIYGMNKEAESRRAVTF